MNKPNYRPVAEFDCNDHRDDNHLEPEIELLGEYSTHLIAGLVTSKLDVREAEAKLDSL